ncbi:hypothetical protein B5F76_13225 [Desulfovibrio sp. An276]|nr:hypothetical protein B5F76_13225 [Desulfovibrio sp. An276]
MQSLYGKAPTLAQERVRTIAATGKPCNAWQMRPKHRRMLPSAWDNLANFAETFAKFRVFLPALLLLDRL